ncbi:MAG TPA: toll/interleukin-1 receptor domain-containing protein [Candidatus Binatia bacterium]|nr:toll/interleukin-1 receptor domain-containing protein [Candidatus Binatia bacterium]
MPIAVDEDVWDDVLAYIEEGTLVPVLGPDLLLVEHEGRQAPLSRLIAESLAKRYRLDVPFSPSAELDQVARAYLKRNPRGSVSDLYRPIRDFLKSLPPQAPPPFLHLAEIRQLNLFVCTTFDGLMVQALDAVRHAGVDNIIYLHFSPKLPADEQERLSRRPPSSKPTVFALFGRASASQDYAIHDEDVLEFIHALFSFSALSPEWWLAEELRNKNLLLLGCHFSDWVNRFIIRMTSATRLSLSADRKVFIVGEGITPDSPLAEFLDLFCRGTRVCDGSAVEFVAELHDRWLARNPQADKPAAPTGDEASGSEPRGSIFLSYVREDIRAARALREAIESLGGDVWLDERRLEPGDRWEEEILRNIRGRIRLFVPLISRQTEQREEGYVFKEWREAVDRSRGIMRRRFIVPVVIDADYAGNPTRYERIPQEFSTFNFGHAPDGTPNEALLAMLQSEIREMRKDRQP